MHGYEWLINCTRTRMPVCAVFSNVPSLPSTAALIMAADNELKGQKWNRAFERCRAALNPMCFSALLCFWLMRKGPYCAHLTC